jgi:hypothetical protein
MSTIVLNPYKAEYFSRQQNEDLWKFAVRVRDGLDGILTTRPELEKNLKPHLGRLRAIIPQVRSNPALKNNIQLKNEVLLAAIAARSVKENTTPQAVR